ncbi:glycosyltransferase [Candidatus Thalassolituus haligoni]|uniref:glycosyltransferase n=1 Tax=Candidatus Thalassolituus haligoni TaxID=3100113 RepID=UPI003518081B
MNDILFVLVSYNSEQYIEDCVRSIMKLSMDGDVKIVLVDNASTDRSVEIANAIEGLDVIELPENLGFGVANNIACNRYCSDFYFIFNIDAYFDGEFNLARVISVFDAYDDVAIVGTKLVYPDGSPQTSSFTYSTPSKWIKQIFPFFGDLKALIMRVPFLLKLLCLMSSDVRSYLENQKMYAPDYSISDVEWISGASMIVRGDYVKMHGLFDENIFLYGEDEDLCLVAKSKGFRVVQQNTNPVVHVHGWNSSGRYNAKVAALKFNSLKFFINKHYAGSYKAVIMRLMLPVYVKGWKNIWR